MSTIEIAALEAALDIVEAAQRLATIRQQVDDITIKRTAEIDAVLLSLVARSTLFMLGPPGVGKTMCIDEVMLRLFGVRYYDLLVGKFTEDSELLGPLDLRELREGRRVRNVEGYLPGVDVGFLDEGLEGTSAALNTILKLINEGTFTNGGVKRRTPLSSLFIASNKTPHGEGHEDLAAFADRLTMWLYVDDPTDNPVDLKALLELTATRLETTTGDEATQPVACWEDVLMLQRHARTIPFGPGIMDKLVDLLMELRTLGIAVSPRRKASVVRMVKATAAIAGSATVTEEHLHTAAHMLWKDPDDRERVARMIGTKLDPGMERAYDLSDDVDKLAEAIAAADALPENDPDRGTQATVAIRKLGLCAKAGIPMADRPDSRSGRVAAGVLTRIDDLYRTCVAISTGLTENVASLTETTRKEMP